MNIFLWVLQVLLALHTVMGAVWKLSNPEQAVPSLSAIPHAVWLVLIGVEVLCAVGLVVPAVSRGLAILVPIAAGIIAAEMLLFCVVHFTSDDGTMGQPIYWLVVAAICAGLGYARFAIKPL